jgi:NNP family nitrate/nitrite transporter-like MFS transporter
MSVASCPAEALDPCAALNQTANPSGRILALSTAAFTLLFAVWLMFGVLGGPIRRELGLSASQMYWLGAAAVLSGSLLRLPFGIFAERFGGRRIMIGLLLWTALPAAAVAYAQGFGQLLALALLFGVAGNAFSVGIAWNAAWTPPARAGLAMGVFGAGNVGASVTKLAGPLLIAALPAAGWLGGAVPGGWRAIPLVYAAALVAMAGVLWVGTPTQDRTPGAGRPLRDMLRPLATTRVWRFGLYYVVVFGAYVAWSLWLPAYFQEVHGCTLAMAGLLTALFIFPASLLRPVGGWLSDRYGARRVTYGAFIGMLILCLPLTFSGGDSLDLPLWLVVTLVVAVGVGMGVGKASVYRYIPEYFPRDVGAVGGLVGTLGALGGVVLLPTFGLLESVGIRTSAFLLLGVLIVGSLLWLQTVVAQLNEQRRKAEAKAAADLREARYAAEETARLAARRARAEAAGTPLDAYGRDLLPTLPDPAAIRNRRLVEFINAANPGGKAVSLALGDGAWIAVHGGAHLLDRLAGLARPAGGSVCFKEREVDGPHPQRPLVHCQAGDTTVEPGQRTWLAKAGLEHLISSSGSAPADVIAVAKAAAEGAELLIVAGDAPASASLLAALEHLHRAHHLAILCDARLWAGSAPLGCTVITV